jgi:hypothetical protein
MLPISLITIGCIRLLPVALSRRAMLSRSLPAPAFLVIGTAGAVQLYDDVARLYNKTD